MAGEADASAAIRPRDLSKILTFQPAAESGLEWVGLYAARFHTAPAFELNEIVLTHHMLALFARPPEELDLLYHGVDRPVPPPAGSIILIPAGSPVRRARGVPTSCMSSEPVRPEGRRRGVELDSALLALAPLDGLNLPHLRAAMLAEDAEMTASGAGGRLAAESRHPHGGPVDPARVGARPARMRARRPSVAGQAARRRRVHRGTPRH